MADIHREVNRYNNAQFKVQSILLPDVSDCTKVEGQLHIFTLDKPKSYKIPGFKPTLTDVVMCDDSIHLVNGEPNPLLEAILLKLKPDMYEHGTPSRKGKISIRAVNEQYIGWGTDFLEKIRARGAYLYLNMELSINPAEWGQTPVKQSGEITAKGNVGGNAAGHRLPTSGVYKRTD